LDSSSSSVIGWKLPTSIARQGCELIEALPRLRCLSFAALQISGLTARLGLHGADGHIRLIDIEMPVSWRLGFEDY
jgi:hypothetical protein